MMRNRKINLVNLYEALELDDTINDIEPDITFKKEKIDKSNNIFNIIANNIFLHKRPGYTLSLVEKDVIDDLKEHPEKYEKLFAPSNLQELKKVILNSLEYLGDNGDYNWIDTSNITSFARLFQNMYSFNGDISKWNTSNVVNMLSTFEGCNAFDKDLSGWDVSNVKYINSVTFKGCKEPLLKCFKAKKFPNNVLNFT